MNQPTHRYSWGLAAGDSRQIIAFYSYQGGVGRTMALCNVASYLTERMKVRGCGGPILCLDLDLEAPSVSTYLRPQAPLRPECSLLQLLSDFDKKFTGRPNAEKEAAWLEGALQCGSPYIYRAREDRELFILPTGLNPAHSQAETVQRADQLQHLLQSIVTAEEARMKLFRRILGKHYAYTLVDCRAGLPGSEFELANALADVIVLFFRPNSTQLIGINLALTAFLNTRGRKVTEPGAPAIPVLSPRPAYTDRRIRQIRDIARENVFRWLNSRPNSLPDVPCSYYDEFIELAFDNTVEIGEPLLIPLGTRQESGYMDDEAPLFIGYRRLAEAFQKGNFEKDALGSEMREAEALGANNLELALEYHLCRLRLEPGNIEHWRRLWTHYGELLQRGSTAKHSVIASCKEYRDKSVSPVAAVESRLWRADFEVSKADRRLRLRMLTEAWEISGEFGERILMSDVLLHLNRLIAEFPAIELPKPLPDRDSAIALHTLEVFHRTLGIPDAFDQLCILENFFGEKPECGDLLEDALRDQLRLAEHSPLRAVILTDLGNHFRQRFQFSEASAAFCQALDEPGCSAEKAELSLDRLIRLLPEDRWREMAMRWDGQLPPKLQRRLRPAQACGALSIDDSEVETWGAAALIPQVLDAWGRDDFARALNLCEACHWDRSRERMPILALTLWLLGEREAVPEALVVEAMDVWDHTRTEINSTYFLLAAWAGNPECVAKHAAGCLKDYRWPIDEFWYRFFAASACGTVEYRNELRKTVKGKPMLARWVFGSEIFFLIRRIWREHRGGRRNHSPASEDVYEFDQLLDFIETCAIESAIPELADEAAGIPRYVDKELQTALQKIASHWQDWARPIADKFGADDIARRPASPHS